MDSVRDEPSVPDGFTVALARTGKEVFVARGMTILDALLEAGVDVPYSCMQGVCGTCEVKVLGGIPDHRDLVLTDAQRAANTSMMICCSGCQGDRLILDL